jgi:hypothetical protein
MMAGKARQIGPYSRPHILAKLDGRTKEAALMRETRARLIEAVGGAPGAVELALIDSAVRLTLGLAQLEAKRMSGSWSMHDDRTFLGWQAHHTKILLKLGRRGKAEPPKPDAHAYLELLRAKAGAAA